MASIVLHHVSVLLGVGGGGMGSPVRIRILRDPPLPKQDVPKFSGLNGDTGYLQFPCSLEQGSTANLIDGWANFICNQSNPVYELKDSSIAYEQAETDLGVRKNDFHT